MSQNFVDLVRLHFGYAKDFGFREVVAEPDSVRYDSGALSLQISHDKISGEISLHLGPRGAGDAYSLSELLRLSGLDPDRQYRDFSTHDPKQIDNGLMRLSSLFRECLDESLLDQPDLLLKLERQKETWAKDYALEINLERARAELFHAWNKQDYGAVVSTLQPLVEHLSSAELKKLEYARRHS